MSTVHSHIPNTISLTNTKYIKKKTLYIILTLFSLANAINDF